MDVFRDCFAMVRFVDGAQRLESLSTLLSAAHAGELEDLPGLACWQRSQVVTALGLLLHLARRYGARPGDPASVCSLFSQALPGSAARLYAPMEEAAFWQHPIQGVPTEALACGHPSEIDLLFTGVAHETKPLPEARGETGHDRALYALVGGGDRISVAKYRSGPRWGLAVAVACDGWTIASEIRAVATAYDLAVAEGEETATGRIWKRGTGPACHMAWLRPAGPEARPCTHKDVAWPWTGTFRPTRLALSGDGTPSATWWSRDTKLADKSLQAHDPHCAQMTEKPLRFREQPERDWKVHLGLLFGGEGGRKGNTYRIDPSRAVQRSALPEASHIRIYGVAYKQGGTCGYRESLYRLPKAPDGFGVPGDSEGDLARRSAMTVREVSRKAVARTARALGLDPAAQCVRFETEAGPVVVQWTLDACAFSGEEAKSPAGLAAGLARDWLSRTLREGGTRAVDAARAEMLLEQGLEEVLGGRRRHGGAWMDRTNVPALYVAASAAADGIAKTLSSDGGKLEKQVRWAVRGSGWPLSVSEALRSPAVRPAWIDAMPEGWKAILSGMSQVRHSPRNDASRFGAVLNRIGAARARVERLLEAQGSSLIENIVSLTALAHSKGARRADWTDPIALALSDCLGDAETIEWSRRSIATSFVRRGA